MSKKFFNINNSIFNKKNVVAIHQQTRTIEVEKTVAVVFVNDNDGVNEHVVFLPEGKTVADFVHSDELNSIS